LTAREGADRRKRYGGWNDLPKRTGHFRAAELSAPGSGTTRAASTSRCTDAQSRLAPDGQLVEIEQRAAGIAAQLGNIRRFGVRSTPNGNVKVERSAFQSERLLANLRQSLQDYCDAVLTCAHDLD
jgi:hypothetical protein